MNALVVDDELKSRLVLKNLLESFCDNINVIGEADNIKSGVASIKELDPDVVFLDINLKEGDSFQILDQLDEITFHIVFVTAYDEDSVKALKYSGIDCLLKPIDIEELQKAVDKLSFKEKNIQMAYEMADGMLKSKFTKIPVITNQGLTFTDISQITTITNIEGKVKLQLLNGHTMQSTRSIKEFMGILDAELFYLINSQNIVNLAQVDKKSSTMGFVHFKNGHFIKVSKEQFNHLIALLN